MLEWEKKGFVACNESKMLRLFVGTLRGLYLKYRMLVLALAFSLSTRSKREFMVQTITEG